MRERERERARVRARGEARKLAWGATPRKPHARSQVEIAGSSRSFTAIRKDAGLYCGSRLRSGEVFAYVGRNQNLKDLKDRGSHETRKQADAIELALSSHAGDADLAAKQVWEREIGNLLPDKQRQRRTCYALCHILYPVSAAPTSIFRVDSNSTSYRCGSMSLKYEPSSEPLHISAK